MRQLLRRLGYLLRQQRQDEELREEIEFHRAMRARELEADGMTPVDAAHAAGRALGNVPLARDHARDVWIRPRLQALTQDIHIALRLLVKERAFTLSAILALALGMAISTTVFTIVNALTRGLPVEAPDRVVAVRTTDARGSLLGLSYPDYRDWRAARRDTLTDIAAFSQSLMTLADAGDASAHATSGSSAATAEAAGSSPAPADAVTVGAASTQPTERLRGAYIAAHTFRLLGEAPGIGRDFVEQDDRPGAPAVALIGYSTWKARYGGDPGVLGRTVVINRRPATIVGVMRDGNQFPSLESLWLPLSQMAGLDGQPRDARVLQAFARLAPGATRAQADAELDAIAARIATTHPETNRNLSAAVSVFPADGPGGLNVVLLASVVCVLLIGCANVASLLLARSARRSREMAIRTSLGATRARIIHQVLVESVVLSLIAGLVGFALSLVGVRLFALATAGINLPYYIQWTMDRRVAGFVLAACIGTGVLFGLVPALHVSKTRLQDILKDGARGGLGGRRASRWGSVLLAGELALTLVLLAGAMLTMRSFAAMSAADRVIDPAPLVTMGVALPDGLDKYATPERRVATYARIEERLRGIRAIDTFALASNLPFIGAPTRLIAIDGRDDAGSADSADPDSADAGRADAGRSGAAPNTGAAAAAATINRPRVLSVAIGDDYFDTLGLAMLRGRAFAPADGAAGQDTVIINQRFASLHFPDADPIGRRIMLIDPGAPAEAVWRTIVGVSPTVRQHFMGDISPVAYVPYRAAPAFFMQIIARAPHGQAASAGLTAMLRREVGAIDADLQVVDSLPMTQAITQSRWIYHAFGGLLVGFAAVALLLSSLGLYAVTAYGVTQRTQEIGLRMALGARRQQVLWMFVRRAMMPLAAGLALGCVGAYGLGRVLRGLLVGTTPEDPVTFIAIGAILVSVAIAACLLPARRAARVDPVTSLRYE